MPIADPDESAHFFPSFLLFRRWCLVNIFSRMSLFALAPLVSGACRAVGQSVLADGASSVVRFFTDRLSDGSLRVVAALADASDRAWRTLEIALAGESL